MKALFPKQNRSRRLLTAGLFVALAASASGPAAGDARADIVARGRIGGADVRVRLQTPDRIVVRAPASRVLRHERVVRYERVGHCGVGLRNGLHSPTPILWSALDRNDHRVAARLSLLTGIRERHLLSERSHGWSWRRIARVHHVAPRTLAAARSHRPLHVYDDPGYGGRGGRGGRGGKGGHGGKGGWR